MNVVIECSGPAVKCEENRQMVLQKIVLAQNTDGLYSHSRGTVEYKNDTCVILKKGAEWTSDAYLNAFSIGKWCTYCALRRISLHLNLTGSFVVRVIHTYTDRKKFCRRQIAGGRVDASEGNTIVYDIPLEKQGVIYFSLKALTDKAVCSGAYFEGDAVTERHVTIALNICTYKREQYLMRNLELLRRAFLENKDSALYGNLRVYITDNGSTLPIGALQDDKVHVCYNPNVGGAGGFARGLIEIGQSKEHENVTHVIFMDDDIELLPEAILRTYTVLRCIREDYQTAFIAGAMLRLDEKYIQHENGAVWNSGKCRFVGRGLDLRQFTNVVVNELYQERDYAAWWYCCVPIKAVRPDNLPVPVFIHEDDVEYSLRNTKKIITMNGIAVWHPVAEHKRVSSNEYYNFRNMLIVNARYCPHFGRWQLAKMMAVRLLTPFLRYRYKDMALVYQALADFCRGPEWLLQIDAPAYHQKIVDMGYKMTDVSEKLKQCRQMQCERPAGVDGVKTVFGQAVKQRGVFRLLWQVMTLNGFLLPPAAEIRAYFMSVHPLDMYRAGTAVLYDDASMQGIEVKRSFGQIFVLILLYMRSLFLIAWKYDRSKSAYQEKWALLQDIQYWRKVYEQ